MPADQTIDHEKVIKAAEAPSLVPDRPIDIEHLARMCGGDQATMQKMLSVFDVQADLLLARMSGEGPKAAAARAHSLAVSARGVGAWKLAECAEDFEKHVLQPGTITLNPAMRRLSAAVSEVHTAIGSLLSQPVR